MKHTRMLAVALAAALPLALGAPLQAAEQWSLPVLYTDPPFDWEGKKTEGVYRSFDGSVSKKWHVCVAFPHVKDPIYLAYSYGAVQQARDLGIKLTIVEAGGYGNLEKQVSQLEDCVAQGADAMVVFALSPTGLNKVVDEARGKGVVVQDCGIGINTEIDARAVASYYQAGVTLGKYLKEKHPKGSDAVKLLWLPGPPGVSWVETTTTGLYDTLADSSVEIVKTMYGDSGKAVQLKMLEDGLQTYRDLTYVAGGAPAIESAVPLLRETGQSDDIGLLAFYVTPGVLNGIKRGSVLGTVIEPSVMFTRMCVDQAVQALEGKKDVDAAPMLDMVDTMSIKDWDQSSALAPAGWKPIFRVD